MEEKANDDADDGTNDGAPTRYCIMVFGLFGFLLIVRFRRSVHEKLNMSLG